MFSYFVKVGTLFYCLEKCTHLSVVTNIYAELLQLKDSRLSSVGLDIVTPMLSAMLDLYSHMLISKKNQGIFKVLKPMVLLHNDR